MGKNKKLKHKETVDAAIDPITISAIASTASTLISSIIGAHTANKQQKQQERLAMTDMAMKNAMAQKQANIDYNEAVANSLQGGTNMLMQQYMSDPSSIGIPSFKKGGLLRSPHTTRNDVIALSPGEAVNMTDQYGGMKTTTVKGSKRDKFADNKLYNVTNPDGSTISSIASNRPFMGSTFADVNRDIAKYFKYKPTDRDWLSGNTSSRMREYGEGLTRDLLGFQNYESIMSGGNRTKTMPSGTSINTFSKGGIIGEPAVVRGYKWGDPYKDNPMVRDYADNTHTASTYGIISAATSLFPAGWNLWQGMKEPFQLTAPQPISAPRNQYAGTVAALMNKSWFPLQQYKDEATQVKNTADYNAKNVGNIGAYRAELQNNTLWHANNLNKIFNAKAQIDAQTAAASAQMLQGIGEADAQRRLNVNMRNADMMDKYNIINSNFAMSRYNQLSKGIEQLSAAGNNIFNAAGKYYGQKATLGPTAKYLESVYPGDSNVNNGLTEEQLNGIMAETALGFLPQFIFGRRHG